MNNNDILINNTCSNCLASDINVVYDLPLNHFSTRSLLCVNVDSCGIESVNKVDVLTPKDNTTDDPIHLQKIIDCADKMVKYLDSCDMSLNLGDDAVYVYDGRLIANVRVDLDDCRLSFTNLRLPVKG